MKAMWCCCENVHVVRYKTSCGLSVSKRGHAGRISGNALLMSVLVGLHGQDSQSAIPYLVFMFAVKRRIQDCGRFGCIPSAAVWEDCCM